MWNVPLYDVIVWLNNSTEDQRLLLHRCLFSPAHPFTYVVNEKSGKRKSMQKPNLELYLMNFIFNEDPDRISKNLVLCSLHFTADLFTNKAQFNARFSERLKLKDDAVPTILIQTVMSHHRFLLCAHYCFVYYRGVFQKARLTYHMLNTELLVD